MEERHGRSHASSPRSSGWPHWSQVRSSAVGYPQAEGHGDQAQQRADDACRDVTGVAVLDKLADALLPANAALSQITAVTPIPARSSARSSP